MSIQVSGIEDINKSLQKLQTKLSSNQPLMAKIGNYIREDIELAFENETSPFGQRWQPLSSVTAYIQMGKGNVYTKNKKRQRKSFLKRYGAGGKKRILVQSGNLARNWHVDAKENEVTVFNNSSKGGFPYGLTHQFGSTNAFGRGINIPARPFLPIDNNGFLEKGLSRQIDEMLENEIEKIFT